MWPSLSLTFNVIFKERYAGVGGNQPGRAKKGLEAKVSPFTTAKQNLLSMTCEGLKKKRRQANVRRTESVMFHLINGFSFLDF